MFEKPYEIVYRLKATRYINDHLFMTSTVHERDGRMTWWKPQIYVGYKPLPIKTSKKEEEFVYVVPHIIEKDPAKQAVIRKKALNESVPFFFPRFEKQLRDNNGYLAGQLSWADFILVGIVESTDLFLTAEVEKGYPSIITLMQKIRALPGVKEYIASMKPYELSNK